MAVPESLLAASDASTSDLGTILTAAAAAPSMNNAQPWRFAIRPHSIAVSADPERRLPHLDPDDRNLHIGVGAAVFNIRVAAGQLGYAPTWRLCPDPEHPLLLSEVELGDRTGNRCCRDGG
jgi:nitroreductase